MHFLCRYFLQMYTSPPMKTSLLTPILASALFAAGIPVASAAYVQSNPAITPLKSTYTSTPMQGMKPPANHQLYYGIPYQGVDRLERTRRDQLLQELSQRVINLQKLRNREGVTPEYTREVNIYERLLRRTGNLGIEHYRAPDAKNYRTLWRNGKLIAVPRLTPSDIHTVIDVYEYDRAVRGSPDDYCSMFSGERQSTCRYQQRVDERNRS